MKRKASASAPQKAKKPKQDGKAQQIKIKKSIGKSDAKFVDTAVATYALDTTGSITHVSIVPQGDTVNQRNGKAFRCTSCQVRGQINSNSATTVAQWAWAIVWDYHPNKALPAVTDILDSINANSYPKRENNERFKLCRYSHGVVAGNTTTPATGREVNEVNEFIKLPKDAIAKCTTADTTGVIGNRIEGALYLISMGDTAAGTGAAALIVGVRVNIVDDL